MNELIDMIGKLLLILRKKEILSATEITQILNKDITYEDVSHG